MTIRAWHAQTPVLAVGTCGLLAGVVFVSQPVVAAVVVLGACACLGWVRWHDDVAIRAWPHALAAGLAALSALGWCASRCGSYALYQDLGGLPTALVAAGLHAAVLAVLVGVQPRPYLVNAALPAALVAVCGGASLFYALILIGGRSWCSACTAAHLLMALQCARLWRSQDGTGRWAMAATLLAVAGGLNAVYHHDLAPKETDDAQALTAYLRSAWPEPDPPQRVIGVSDELAATRRSGAALREHLRHLHEESQPLPSRAGTTEPVPAGAAEPALRPLADANRWGVATAPVTILVGIDSGCPVCAQQFAQLLELSDLVAHGSVQMRFLISYRGATAQATASLAYAGGLVGEGSLIDCLSAFYGHQHDLLLPADAVAALPTSLPALRAIGLLRSHHDAISTLLADAVTLKGRLGATGDPTLWVMRSPDATPARIFQGLTVSSIIRLAVGSLLPEEEIANGQRLGP